MLSKCKVIVYISIFLILKANGQYFFEKIEKQIRFEETLGTLTLQFLAKAADLSKVNMTFSWTPGTKELIARFQSNTNKQFKIAKRLYKHIK